MRKVLKYNVLILIALLFLLNVMSYLILRFYENKHQKNLSELPAMTHENYHEIQNEFIQLETEYQPFIGWKRKPTRKKYTTIQEDGNRITLPLNPNSKRVIRFFGGSTMWGTGVDDSNTIPSLFGTCNDKFKVYNHGETGFNSRQNLATLINLIVEEDSTDIVVFYDGVNDVEHLCRKEISIPGHGREIQMREKLATVNSTQSTLRGKDSIFKLGTKLLSKVFIKHTAKLVQKIIGKFVKRKLVFSYSCHSNKKRASQVAQHLLNNWKLAYQLAEANEISFIAILQPNIYLGDVQKEYLDLSNYGPLENDFKEVYQILKKEIINYDWIYDFTEILNEENSPLYYDFCHINERGNEIVAHQICEIISNLE